MKKFIPFLFIIIGCNKCSVESPSTRFVEQKVVVKSIETYEGVSILHRVDKYKAPGDKKYLVTTAYFNFLTDSLYNPGDTLIISIQKK